MSSSIYILKTKKNNKMFLFNYVQCSIDKLYMRPIATANFFDSTNFFSFQCILIARGSKKCWFSYAYIGLETITPQDVIPRFHIAGHSCFYYISKRLSNQQKASGECSQSLQNRRLFRSSNSKKLKALCLSSALK